MAQDAIQHVKLVLWVREIDLQPHVVERCRSLESIVPVLEPPKLHGQATGIDAHHPLTRLVHLSDLRTGFVVVNGDTRSWGIDIDL